MLTLTPQARAIATFALAFMLVTGTMGRVGLSIALVLSPHGNLSPKTVAVIIALVSAAIGIAVTVIANQAVPRLEPGWSQALAQAAILLAVIGTGIAALDLLSSLLGDGMRPGYYFGSVG